MSRHFNKHGKIFWVSDEDDEFVKSINWTVEKAGNTSYVRESSKRDGKRQLLHRLLAASPEKPYVDHIDGNGLNNRRDNLRAATNRENQANSRLNVRNTSGFKNVSWDKTRERWRVGTWDLATGKTGTRRFLDYDEAVTFAKSEAVRLHGEFARTA